MINSKREVTDFDDIIDILSRCDTLRVAFGGDTPYVVPVSFGMKKTDRTLVIYFHGAKRGLKYELTDKHPNVCFESDICHKIEEFAHGITARYESVIGFGKIERIESEEKLAALQAICAHYGRADYSVANCSGLAATAVYKITVDSITGKRNI